MRVAVVGAGSWGTTVAALATQNASSVVLWARRPQLAEAIDTGHENPDYLPGRVLPSSLRATSDLAGALAGADAVVLAVPSHGLRGVLGEARSSVPAGVPVVSLAKGLESGSLKRMTEVVTEVLDGHPPDRVGVLTGPNLAVEVVAGMPTASVVAMVDPEAAECLQRLFMTSAFRVYTNPDVVGCEIAGVLKNVVAIAAGAAQGLGCGDNAGAALITRGLAELTRLGLALGGNPLTFLGLAGIGDLVVTCTSQGSRNRYVGEELGKGRRLDDILAEMHMVAEGVRSTESVLALAAGAGVEMPIAEQVQAVLDGRSTPLAAVSALMLREAKAEMHGIRIT
ncbi:MAG: NAD(P)H-dependent glycerol-3-phosphate dehydrogenase, partial [Acidimicrobiia bacterium]